VLLLELELELLLESEPGIGGGVFSGKGCSLSAEGCGASGAGVLGAIGWLGSPGNGNCSAAEGGVPVEEGVQGLSWVEAWFAAHGGSAGFCPRAAWPYAAAMNMEAASRGRIVERIAIVSRLLALDFDVGRRGFVIVSDRSTRSG
jgi:hypothetical protein